MECIVRADIVKDWLSGSGQLAHSAPSSSSLCSTMCRRAASFPIVSRHQPVPSLLKVRSQSESEALNRLGVTTSRAVIIDQLKRRQQCPAVIPEELPSRNCDSLSEGDSCEEASSGISSSADDGDVADMGSLITPSQPSNFFTSHKSVRFADDCGQELATVRVMTEPSDYPPMINPSVIRRLLGKTEDDDDNDSEQSTASWVVAFKQPASEYVKFRETLEVGMVALENVMLKNDVCRMLGTVKVKNISFEKRVFIRFTSDGWKSYMDRVATFQPSSSKMYDTFSFDVAIPPNGNDPYAKIEFCICFETGSSNGDSKPQQYWDSNGGKNYQLRSSESSSTAEHRQVPPLFGRQDLNDAYVSDYENWTKFASWKNLSTDGPYW